MNSYLNNRWSNNFFYFSGSCITCRNSCLYFSLPTPSPSPCFSTMSLFASELPDNVANYIWKWRKETLLWFRKIKYRIEHDLYLAFPYPAGAVCGRLFTNNDGTFLAKALGSEICNLDRQFFFDSYIFFKFLKNRWYSKTKACISRSNKVM